MGIRRTQLNGYYANPRFAIALNLMYVEVFELRSSFCYYRISQALTQRVKELAEHYETPLPQMVNQVTELEAKVNCPLEKMGFHL